MRRAYMIGTFVLAVLLASLVAMAAVAVAGPAQIKLLAHSSTTLPFAAVSASVYTRDDPEYKSDLRYYRGRLAEAQARLREAQNSIEQVGELTPAQKRAREEYLRPYREDVANVKDDLADLSRDYVKPFRAYGFRVAGSGSIELEWRLTCKRGNHENGVGEQVTRSAPFEVWRPPTVARAAYCRASAFARRAGSSRLVLSALGRR